MKKRDKKDSQDNVILFPDLDKRLAEKGLEKLQQKKFTEAIDFFEQAYSMGVENSETYIGLILANVEAGSLEEAKRLAEEMLRKNLGDYLQIIDLYLMILIQLHEYDQVVTTLEGLLEEKEVPPEKFENFLKMLHFCRRMAESTSETKMEMVSEQEVYNRDIQLRVSDNPRDQMLVVAQLAHQNVRAYIEEIKEYLRSSEGDPFVKSMVLNVLKEQDYNETIFIQKLDYQGEVIPTNLPDIQSNSQVQRIKELLEEYLEQENPVLYENVKSLVERQFFLLYPFTPELEENALAAAYHLVATEYHGDDLAVEDVAELYLAKEEEVVKAVPFIKKIEEISYPII